MQRTLQRLHPLKMTLFSRCFGTCVLILGSTVLSMRAQAPLPEAPQSQSSGEQSAVQPEAAKAAQSRTWRSKYGKTHIPWILPNFRADEESDVLKPLTPREKFKVAFDDSFDFSSFIVAGALAGFSMAQSQYPSFGQGAQGYAKYFGGAFADQAVGDYMTEAILPTVLHQDPRYFVKGRGGFIKRTKYAITREVITRSDQNTAQFNTSEIGGNAVAAGIANIYYPDRSFSNTASRWGTQIGLDAFFNILKEFWPDVRQSVFHQ